MEKFLWMAPLNGSLYVWTGHTRSHTGQGF